MTEVTNEVTYEDLPPARVIATYQDPYGRVSLRDWMIQPMEEESIAAMVEQDQSLHCFFIELSTDMSAIETIPVEQYRALREAEAAAALEEA